MKKQLNIFIKDSIWYSIQPIFTKVFNFVLIPIYTAYLTPSDYGNLQYILTFGAFFRAFTKLGVISSFWKYKTGSSIYSKSDVCLNFTLIQLLCAITVLIISGLIQLFLLKGSKIFLFIIVYFIAETIKIIFDNVQVIQRSNHNSMMYVVGTITQTIIILLLNILFVVYLKMNFIGVVYSYLIGFFITSAIFIPTLYKASHEGKINIPLIRDMVSYGFPIMIGNVAAIIISLSDRFFLKRYTNDYELGLYSYGYKYADLVNSLLIGTFFLSWNPIRWDIYEMSNGKEIFQKFNRLLFIALPIAGLIILSLSQLLAAVLTLDEGYLRGMSIIYMIGFGYILYGLYYFNAMGMLFTNKTGKITLVIALSGLINIVFNFALIPRIGMIGAAISTILSYLSMFLLGRYYCQRYYPIERTLFFEVSQIITNLIIVGILTYISYIVKNLYLMACITLASSLIVFVINILFKNISLKEILQLKTYFLEAKNHLKKRKA